MAQTRAQVAKQQTNGHNEVYGHEKQDSFSSASSKDDGNKKSLINGIPLKVYKRNINVGFLASLAFMVGFFWLVWTDEIKLSGNINAEKLTGYGLKAEFTFRYLILGVLWLIFNVQAVIYDRMSPALDPMNGREDLTQANNNILNNSLEQFVITVVTQLSVISYLTGPQVVRIIPVMNFLFLIGRIAFFLGYPRYRTFGFITTSLPPTIAASFSAFRFGTHLGLY